MKRYELIGILIICSGVTCAQRIFVQPYLQPGNVSNLKKEQKVIIWQTDSVAGNFKVSFQLKGDSKVSTAKVQSVVLKLKGETTRLYRATLPDLKFDTVYQFRVELNEQEIENISFNTRSTKSTTRFAVLGDFGAGSRQQAAIAYRMAEQKPQFVITTGDNAYENGLEEDYRRNVFPFYLPVPNPPENATPLMNTIPFYMVLGNHDVRMDSLDEAPGAFAYFYYSDLPLNGPFVDRPPTIRGSSKLVKLFKKNTKPRFPRISNFSFDYGNVHFTCLDANDYVNPLDPALVAWLKRDIGNSKADWKIVVFHHPGFNSSLAHYDFQLMRLLAPEFEKLKVNLVLTGHVHNYQRSVPLTFKPEKKGDRYIISPEGRVNGAFVLDTLYDGETRTKPEGIIYIVTGAGGGSIYDPQLSQKPDLWKHNVPGNWVPFTKQLISDRHSFTFIETNKKLLTLKQIDLTGKVIDTIRISQ